MPENTFVADKISCLLFGVSRNTSVKSTGVLDMSILLEGIEIVIYLWEFVYSDDADLCFWIELPSGYFFSSLPLLSDVNEIFVICVLTPKLYLLVTGV